MDELLEPITEKLSVGDFLVVHKGCEIETVSLGIITGGLHAKTLEEGHATRTFMLRCVIHDVTSEEFMQELPRS